MFGGDVLNRATNSTPDETNRSVFQSAQQDRGGLPSLELKGDQAAVASVTSSWRNQKKKPCVDFAAYRRTVYIGYQRMAVSTGGLRGTGE